MGEARLWLTQSTVFSGPPAALGQSLALLIAIKYVLTLSQHTNITWIYKPYIMTLQSKQIECKFWVWDIRHQSNHHLSSLIFFLSCQASYKTYLWSYRIPLVSWSMCGNSWCSTTHTVSALLIIAVTGKYLCILNTVCQGPCHNKGSHFTEEETAQKKKVSFPRPYSQLATEQ
jgi:hypothetical protein